MRKRIQQLASGKFEYARPLLSFSTDKVEIDVLEGKDYTGDFVITSANRVPMRGIIYSSDARMECLTPQFEGEEVRIRYQFHSNGLVEGDIQKGDFLIVCNQGEYNLSFVASISKLYADTSLGKIKNLTEFSELAKQSQAEAYHLFFSKNFKNMIRLDEIKARLLYEGLSKGAASMQKVEEFLVGIQKKEPVAVHLMEESAKYSYVTESRKENVEIYKEHWGSIEINVRSDAPFLVPAKMHLTEEDFIGSVCIFDYYIYEEKLHAGRNYGRLFFEFPGHELCFEVCASRGDCGAQMKQSEHREIAEGRVRLMQLYMDYRLKRIVTGVWANQSIEVLDHLMAIEPDKELYPLMKAQALIVNKQRQEASWIMDDYKRQCTNRESQEWGYYLYLCTLMEREPVFVDRMAEQIELLFCKNPDSSLLFWVLLFVRESYYLNHAKRYRAIEQWVSQGNCSPYFYLEAYYLIWQDPYLIGRMGGFEVAVLNWARKQKAISKDIALQILHVVPDLREFDPFVFQLLEECYRIHPENETIAVICGYLIKSQRYEAKYHKWYELGIEHEIRLTGLYEAYLMSLDTRRVERVPKMIQMYFQYDSTLAYQQKAVLFVNIIAEKLRQPEVYQKYQRTMEQFAMQQMEAGHISDNLAVIYDEMLRMGVLSKELARHLSGILFTHKLTCMDRQVARAIIWHEELKEPQIVPFVNGVAYFNAYTANYSVVLEDTSGNRFCKSVPWQDEALMNPAIYIERCITLAPEEVPYILYYMRGRSDKTGGVKEKKEYLVRLLKSEGISTGYQAQLMEALLQYYQSREQEFIQDEAMICSYLEQGVEEYLATTTKRHLIEMLSEAHLYAQAYRMVQNDGYDYLGSAARVALCSYAITDCQFEEDDFLIGFAESTFMQGKYNDVLLIYLCKYYNGATKQMAKLWKAAGEFQIDTYDLEERILTQMLYTTDYTPYAEQIYDSYYAGGGRDLICMAYLSYFANSYLMQDAVIPSQVFPQIQERYLEGRELNEACELGLLKYLSEKEKLSDRQLGIVDALLGVYTSKNIYFAFYRKFPAKLIVKYHFYDKYFLEYHTTPGKHVMVHFRMGENDYQSEDLIEMYDGIFVREFILFFGEMVQYYITEGDGTNMQVIESDCITNNDVIEHEKEGRYVRLNEMLLQVTLGDEEMLKRQMKNYYGMLRVTEEAFKLL